MQYQSNCKAVFLLELGASGDRRPGHRGRSRGKLGPTGAGSAIRRNSPSGPLPRPELPVKRQALPDRPWSSRLHHQLRAGRPGRPAVFCLAGPKKRGIEIASHDSRPMGYPFRSAGPRRGELCRRRRASHRLAAVVPRSLAAPFCRARSRRASTGQTSWKRRYARIKVREVFPLCVRCSPS